MKFNLTYKTGTLGTNEIARIVQANGLRYSPQAYADNGIAQVMEIYDGEGECMGIFYAARQEIELAEESKLERVLNDELGLTGTHNGLYNGPRVATSLAYSPRKEGHSRR